MFFRFWLLVRPLLASANAQASECQVTLAQYQQLKTGMSYSKVVGVLGCEGSELSRVEMAGYKTEMFMWEGRGILGANMNVMLQNDKLLMRAQCEDDNCDEN